MADDVHDAMHRLGWSARDLFAHAVAYGSVGTLRDVEEHLRTGDHLGPEARVFIATALRDAELGEAPVSGDVP